MNNKDSNFLKASGPVLAAAAASSTPLTKFYRLGVGVNLKFGGYANGYSIINIRFLIYNIES
ncbi:hypothetical protein C1N53_02310 [Pontibacter sp. SGAir0037]|nr:hypothetical protein C1N53_02310 [Pontibacter sp. SGAir0037]